jgi:hypothetical protein
VAEEQDPVDRVVAQAGRVAGWLARTSWQAASRLPGGEAAQRQFRKAEKAVLDEVRRRLDAEETFTERLIGESPAVVDGQVDAVRSALGGPQRIVLRNASSVGRAAGVMLPDLVPNYVTRLESLGVVEVGPEDPALGVQYDILLTEDRVRAAEEEVRTVRKLTPRYARRTLRLSTLGEQFWTAADPAQVG